MSPDSREMQLVRIAGVQHGCVAAGQLAAAGATRSVVAGWCAKGWLQRRHRGVYLVGPLESPHTAAMAALLAVGPDAALSHRSAAVLHGLLAAQPGAIDVVVPRRGPRSRPGIRIHTTRDLPQSAVRTRHGMRVTGPERTLRDLPARERDRATEQAHVLGLVRDAGGDPAFTRSEAERRMLALIRAADLPTPKVNTRVGPIRGRPALAGRAPDRRGRRLRVPLQPRRVRA